MNLISKNRTFSSIGVAAFLSLISGCSGGGGGGGTSAPPPPVNSAPTLNSPVSYQIDENTDLILTLDTGDVDGDAVTVAIGGPDAEAFSFDASNQTLVYTLCGLNYEVPFDTNTDGVFEFDLSLSDGRETSEYAITVTILDDMNEPDFGSGLAFVTPTTDTAGPSSAAGDVGVIGDLNCDGFPEFFVAEGNAKVADPLIYIYSGKNLLQYSDTFLDASAVSAMTISGHSFYGPGIKRVSAIGDVDGDGLIDLGISRDSSFVMVRGSVLKDMINSGTDLDLATASLGAEIVELDAISAIGASLHFGQVSAVGDLTNDGRSEFLVAQDGVPHNQLLIFGEILDTVEASDGLISSSELSSMNEVVQFSNNDRSDFQFVQSSGIAGDLDGDGLTELLFGRGGTNGQNGRTYVVSSSTLVAARASGDQIVLSELSNRKEGISIDGTSTSGFGSGRSVSGFGDATGDGINDILIGSNWRYLAADGNAIKDALSVNHNLSWDELLAVNPSAFLDRSNVDLTGMSMPAGDIDLDGSPDILISKPKALDPISGLSGVVFVVFGDSLFDNSSETLDVAVSRGRAVKILANSNMCGSSCINTFRASITMGGRVAPVGDIDGDGYTDIMIAPGEYDRIGVIPTQPRLNGAGYLLSGRALAERRVTSGGSGTFYLSEVDSN